MTKPKHQLITEELDKIIQSSDLVGVLLVDIVGFSELNTGLGFHKCDALLNEVKRFISGLIDQSDTVHHFYADKFVVIIEHSASYREVVALANYLKQSFNSTPVKVNSLEVPIEVLVSYCWVNDLPPSGAAVLNSLEWSLNSIKDQPHSSHSPLPNLSASTDEIISNVSRYGLIREAIRNGEMHNYYQPIFDMVTNSIIGVESLVRWINPTVGVIPPSAFLPSIEKNNQMGQLTQTVLNNILRDFSQHDLVKIKHYNPDFYISVNVPPTVLLDPSFRNTLLEISNTNPIYKNTLAVEITEQSLDTPLSVIGECCDHFERNGIRVLIDDFGTGYSSLNRIAKLPISAIKVDRTFLMDTKNLDINACIIKFALDIANKRGLQVVFEGVSNQAAMDFALSLGAKIGQGFHFSKPISSAELLNRYFGA